MSTEKETKVQLPLASGHEHIPEPPSKNDTGLHAPDEVLIVTNITTSERPGYKVVPFGAKPIIAPAPPPNTRGAKPMLAPVSPPPSGPKPQKGQPSGPKQSQK